MTRLAQLVCFLEGNLSHKRETGFPSSSSSSLVSVAPLYLDTMPPNQGPLDTQYALTLDENERDYRIRCAILGCGMMGQEHCSYIMGYPSDLRIDFLCDPHEPSVEKCLKVMAEFKTSSDVKVQSPVIFASEEELLKHVDEIDLLLVASPNYMHTDTLIRWGKYDITILLEKPVAVSQDQHDRLKEFAASADLKARVWVAMEYRFIPAVAKLLDLLPTIGDIKMCTIRENRYPFLHKINGWNRDREKTGDSLVEKCCHFFDLMRLITGKEASLDQVRALAQRGVNYLDEPVQYGTPIIDSAYVMMPFRHDVQEQPNKIPTIGCLELSMFAEGSRHQEEIIVTGTKGRLEAYLPENKVYAYERPDHEVWADRSIPPPKTAIKERIYDCSDVRDVFGIENEMPTHGGYHYSSTAVEWFRLLGAMNKFQNTGMWQPDVSLDDGLRAVEIGLRATTEIVNEKK